LSEEERAYHEKRAVLNETRRQAAYWTAALNRLLSGTDQPEASKHLKGAAVCEDCHRFIEVCVCKSCPEELMGTLGECRDEVIRECGEEVLRALDRRGASTKLDSVFVDGWRTAYDAIVAMLPEPEEPEPAQALLDAWMHHERGLHPDDHGELTHLRFARWLITNNHIPGEGK
jgi:hypothetical protein